MRAGFLVFFRVTLPLGSKTLMSCRSCNTPVYTSRSDLCIACAGAHQLIAEFKDKWDSEAVRSIAADVCLSAVRQVRALKVYQRGLRSAQEREEAREAERRKETGGGRAKGKDGSPTRGDRKDEGRRGGSGSRGREREPAPREEDDEYSEDDESAEAESPRAVGRAPERIDASRTLTAKAKAGPAGDRGRSSSHRDRGEEKEHKFEKERDDRREVGSRERSRSRRRGEGERNRSGGYGYRQRKDSHREDLLPPGLLKIHSPEEEKQWPTKRKRTRRRR